MQFSAVDTELEYEEDAQPESAEPQITTIPVLVDTDCNVVLDMPVAGNPIDIGLPAANTDPVEQPMDVGSDIETTHTPDNLEVTETALEEIPHTSTQTPRFASLLSKPVVKKVVKAVNSRRITEARCLTADEIFKAEEEKKQKKERELAEKEARKVESERKREEKQKQMQEKQVQKPLKQKRKEDKQKQMLDKENKKERKRKATAKTTYDRNDPKNYCAHCDGFWEDDEEPEDWWQCITCEDWFHESCTGLFGRPNELQTYVCSNCKE